MTEDEVKKMRGIGRDLLDQLILIQYIKRSKVVTRTAAIMNRFGHSDEAMQLRGW